MPLLLQPRDRFLVRQIVRQRERIDPRRHAILRRLVAQLDDFLDHLAFGFLQRAFLFAHLDQRLEFFIAQPRPLLQMARGEAIDHRGADVFEQMPDPIEQRHQTL